MTVTHGDYDRDEETQDILDNPPASVGNPGAGSVLSQLKARFAKLDEKATTFIRAENRGPDDLGLWLEIDKDITLTLLNQYREAERGNRAARRTGDGTINMDRVHARILVEHCVGIYAGDPRENAPVQDDQGRPVILRDEQWINDLGCPGDPISAVLRLFGSGHARTIAGTALVEAGIDGDLAEVVDPTTGSSGD